MWVAQAQPGNKTDQLIAQILQSRKAGWDLSLDRINKLLVQLGNPQTKLPRPIHIAGTNGKGSTASFCRALLETAGYKTHVYSSPHLVNWRERFRINGKLIEEERLCELINDIAAIAESDVTLFEILTACAMLEFTRVPADATIFEVGLGGRLDATNVIAKPACCIITPISFDHCHILGSEITAIAAEKAAIIKPGCNIVIAQQKFAAAQTAILEQAARMQSKVSLYGQDFVSYIENGQMIFQNDQGLLQLPKPILPGQHQLINAASAIEAVQKTGIKLTENSISQALQTSYWPGRLQKITSGKLYQKLGRPLIWLDGAHNEDGAQQLANFFAQRQQKIILIMGMLTTKDPRSFLTHFKDLTSYNYFVPLDDHANAWSAETLLTTGQELLHSPCSYATSLKQALSEAVKRQNPDPIIVTGSLHLVGEFLQLNETPPN